MLLYGLLGSEWESGAEEGAAKDSQTRMGGIRKLLTVAKKVSLYLYFRWDHDCWDRPGRGVSLVNVVEEPVGLAEVGGGRSQRELSLGQGFRAHGATDRDNNRGAGT